MADKRFFIDVFDEIVQKIQAKYDTVNDPVETPYGLYGTKKEIINILTEKDQSQVWKFKKYPLIILYKPVTENRGEELSMEYRCSPLISIVTNSTRELRTQDRYTGSVKPILYPIYDLLLEEIADNPDIYQTYSEEIKHTFKVWDGNPNTAEGGILYNDYLDGIDIQFTDLKIFRQNTCVE